MGFIDARLREMEARREFTQQQEYDRMLETLRVRFGEDELATFIHRRRELTADRAFAEALDAQPDVASISHRA